MTTALLSGFDYKYGSFGKIGFHNSMAWEKVLFVLVCLAPRSVISASITLSLNQGVCLCVNEPNVVALTDPSNPATSVGTLANGACFTSTGSIYHNNLDTYYQLRDDNNQQVAWVDSFFLSISPSDQCASAHATKQTHHTATGQGMDCRTYGIMYTHGQHFSLHGLQCTCDDGATVCSMTGNNCFADGIVFQHGSSFSITGRGSCTCSLGNVQCLVG